PAGLPAEHAPGLGVRPAADLGHLQHRSLAGQQPDHEPGPPHRLLRAQLLGQERQPLAHRCRVRLTEVRSTVTGDIDLNGILGLDPEVRNGYQGITVRFTIRGAAPAEKLRELVEQSRARSAVYDVVTNGVPVTIQVDTP